MRLGQLISLMEAGGPGSGRHKGSGSTEPVHQATHDFLTKGGSEFAFEHKGNKNGSSVYKDGRNPSTGKDTGDLKDNLYKMDSALRG